MGTSGKNLHGCPKKTNWNTFNNTEVPLQNLYAAPDRSVSTDGFACGPLVPE